MVTTKACALSPRLPVEPLVTGREECVSAGEDARPHRLSSAICQFIEFVQRAFRHDTISSVFAHTSRYNVTDMPNLSLTRRPPTLTRDVRHERHDWSTRKRSRIKLRIPHITMHRLIYGLATESVSPSGQITWSNKATDLHIAGPKPPVNRNQPNSQYSDEPGILWAIPIRIPAA